MPRRERRRRHRAAAREPTGWQRDDPTSQAHDHANGPEHGGATVWVLAAGLVTLLVAVAATALGAAVVARHRAQSAADLTALAGASHGREGEPSACAAAATTAARNGARMVACHLDGLDLTVSVDVIPAGPAKAVGTAHASARAGPVEVDVGP